MTREKGGRRPPKPEGVENNPRHPGKFDPNAKAPLPSLQDVSRQLPTAEEIGTHFDRIKQMPDREAVMALSALLDAFLENALAILLTGKAASSIVGIEELPKTIRDELFREASAPLASWSSKIILAHSMRLFDDEMRSQLDTIRRIRNAFAHAVRPLDFTNPTLADAASRLDVRRMVRGSAYVPDRTDARGRIEEGSGLIAGHLLHFVNSAAQGLKAGILPKRTTFESKFVGRDPLSPQSPGSTQT